MHNPRAAPEPPDGTPPDQNKQLHGAVAPSVWPRAARPRFSPNPSKPLPARDPAISAQTAARPPDSKPLPLPDTPKRTNCSIPHTQSCPHTGLAAVGGPHTSSSSQTPAIPSRDPASDSFAPQSRSRKPARTTHSSPDCDASPQLR